VACSSRRLSALQLPAPESALNESHLVRLELRFSELLILGLIMRQIVEVLQPNSEMLASIQSKFHNMLNVRRKLGREIEIVCFYEELAHNLYGMVSSSDFHYCDRELRVQ
jgi:hypothetical protein